MSMEKIKVEIRLKIKEMKRRVIEPMNPSMSRRKIRMLKTTWVWKLIEAWMKVQ